MPGNSWDEAKYVFTPPLREKWNQEALWGALADGALSVVSTDHCPFRFADQKSLGRDDFRKIPNGGPGIENRLQILWHFGVNSGRLTPERFVELAATAPPRIFGMPQKGSDRSPAKTPTSSSGTPTPTTPSRPPPNPWPPTTTCSKAGRSRATPDTSSPAASRSFNDGKWIGQVGRGRFLKRQPNAGGFAG